MQFCKEVVLPWKVVLDHALFADSTARRFPVTALLEEMGIGGWAVVVVLNDEVIPASSRSACGLRGGRLPGAVPARRRRVIVEMGCDAVLVNSAVAAAGDPVAMAAAFAQAVEAGRAAHRAGIMPRGGETARSTSPLTTFLSVENP